MFSSNCIKVIANWAWKLMKCRQGKQIYSQIHICLFSAWYSFSVLNTRCCFLSFIFFLLQSLCSFHLFSHLLCFFLSLAKVQFFFSHYSLIFLAFSVIIYVFFGWLNLVEKILNFTLYVCIFRNWDSRDSMVLPALGGLDFFLSFCSVVYFYLLFLHL